MFVLICCDCVFNASPHQVELEGFALALFINVVNTDDPHVFHFCKVYFGTMKAAPGKTRPHQWLAFIACLSLALRHTKIEAYDLGIFGRRNEWMYFFL